MSEDPTPEASEEAEPEPVTITAPDLWGAIEQLFSHYYNGVLVRGLVLLDIYDTDGERQFTFEAPDDTAPWDVRSLCQEAIDDVNRVRAAVTLLQIMEQEMAEAAEEDEAEDDE